MVPWVHIYIAIADFECDIPSHFITSDATAPVWWMRYSNRACSIGVVGSAYQIAIGGFVWWHIIEPADMIFANIVYCRKGSHDLLLLSYAIDLHCLGSSLLWFLFIPITSDSSSLLWYSLRCSNILYSDISYDFRYSLLWYSAILLRYVNSFDISPIFYVNSSVNSLCTSVDVFFFACHGFQWPLCSCFFTDLLCFSLASYHHLVS